jgi:hypothetical protein
MRVVCIDLVNQVTGENETVSPWLRLHAEYEVLEVYCSPSRRVKLRIVADDAETPALFDSAMFMTIDDSLRPSWVASIREGGELRIGPLSWMREGFWEDFFDGNRDTLLEYRREANVGDGH